MTPPPSQAAQDGHLAAIEALRAAETAVDQLLTQLYDTPDAADRAALMSATSHQVMRQHAIASDEDRRQEQLFGAELIGIARVLTALKVVEEARATGTARAEVCWPVEDCASLQLDLLVQAREVADRYRLMTQELHQALVPAVGAAAAAITLTVADTLLDPAQDVGGAEKLVCARLDAAALAYQHQLQCLHGLDDPQERAQALRGMRALLLVQARLLRRGEHHPRGASASPCTAAEVEHMATLVDAVAVTEVSQALCTPRPPAGDPVIEAAADQVLDQLAIAVDPDERHRLMAVHLYNAVAPHTGANAALVITEIAATIPGVTPPLGPGQPIDGPGRPQRTASGMGTKEHGPDEDAGDVLQGTVGPAPSARPELWEQIPGTPPLTGSAAAWVGGAWDIPAPASDAEAPAWRRNDADETIWITVEDPGERSSTGAGAAPTAPTSAARPTESPVVPSAQRSEERHRAIVAGFALTFAVCVLVITWLPPLGLIRTVLTITALLMICGGIATFAGLLTKWTQTQEES